MTVVEGAHKSGSSGVVFVRGVCAVLHEDYIDSTVLYPVVLLPWHNGFIVD